MNILIISLIICHFLELFYFLRKDKIEKRDLNDFVKRYEEWIKQNSSDKKEG